MTQPAQKGKMNRDISEIERAVELLLEDLVHAESGSDLELKILLAHFIKFQADTIRRANDPASQG